MNEARSAFEWFLGRNDLGQELYDPGTGGCCDGLQEDRRQPEPGGRIDPRLPPLPRRDEPAGKLPGGIPPGAVVSSVPRTGRHPPQSRSAISTHGRQAHRDHPQADQLPRRHPAVRGDERGPDREDHRTRLVPLRGGGRVPAGEGDAGVPRAAPADPRILPAPLRAGPQPPADRPAAQRESAAADRLLLHPGIRAWNRRPCSTPRWSGTPTSRACPTAPAGSSSACGPPARGTSRRSRSARA